MICLDVGRHLHLLLVAVIIKLGPILDHSRQILEQVVVLVVVHKLVLAGLVLDELVLPELVLDGLVVTATGHMVAEEQFDVLVVK